jgi:hypothetical protein
VRGDSVEQPLDDVFSQLKFEPTPSLCEDEGIRDLPTLRLANGPAWRSRFA